MRIPGNHYDSDVKASIETVFKSGTRLSLANTCGFHGARRVEPNYSVQHFIR